MSADSSDLGTSTRPSPRIPLELLEHIASFSDTETHAVLGAVCRALVDLSRRRVFRHLTANRMESLRISHLVNELAKILESPLSSLTLVVNRFASSRTCSKAGSPHEGRAG